MIVIIKISIPSIHTQNSQFHRQKISCSHTDFKEIQKSCRQQADMYLTKCMTGALDDCHKISWSLAEDHVDVACHENLQAIIVVCYDCLLGISMSFHDHLQAMYMALYGCLWAMRMACHDILQESMCQVTTTCNEHYPSPRLQYLQCSWALPLSMQRIGRASAQRTLVMHCSAGMYKFANEMNDNRNES